MHFLLTFLLLFTFPKEREIKLQLEKGETYSMSTLAEMDITQQIMQQENKIHNVVAGNMEFEVQDFVDGQYKMKVTYTSLGMVMSMPATNTYIAVSTDSAKQNPASPLEPIFKKMFDSMIGKSFSLDMSQYGTVSNIQGMDVLYNSMVEAFPELPQAAKEQIIAQAKKNFGAKALKGNIEMLTAIYPEKPVNVGEQWSSNIKMEAAMNSDIQATFALDETTADYLQISGKAKIEADPNSPYVDMNGMSMQYLLNGEYSSSLKLDPETNWILSGEVSQQMSGDVNVKPNAQLPEGMVMPMEIKSEMTVN